MGGTPLSPDALFHGKIPSINGWFGGTPILGNPHLKLIDLMKLAKLSTHWSGGSSGEENPRKFRRKKNPSAQCTSSRGPRLLAMCCWMGSISSLYQLISWDIGCYWGCDDNNQPMMINSDTMWYSIILDIAATNHLWDSMYVYIYICAYDGHI